MDVNERLLPGGSEADLEQASRTSDSVRSAACAVGEHSDNDAAASQESTSAKDHENSVELALSEVVIVRSPYEPIDPAVMELWRGWPLVLQVTLSLVLACVEHLADIILYVNAEREQMLVFTMVYASTYASLVGGGAYFWQRCCLTAPVQHRDIVKVGLAYGVALATAIPSAVQLGIFILIRPASGCWHERHDCAPLIGLGLLLLQIIIQGPAVWKFFRMERLIAANRTDEIRSLEQHSQYPLSLACAPCILFAPV